MPLSDQCRILELEKILRVIRKRNKQLIKENKKLRKRLEAAGLIDTTVEVETRNGTRSIIVTPLRDERGGPPS